MADEADKPDVLGMFKCPVCHQSYAVTTENKQNVVEHVRKHRDHETVDEAWLDEHIRPDSGQTTESTTETE